MSEKLRVTTTTLSRSYISVTHLSSAALFSQRANEIESKVTKDNFHGSNIRREHSACIVSSIMLSVSFLEALINEFYTDCFDHHKPEYFDLPNYSCLVNNWKNGFPRTAKYTVVEKYRIALEIMCIDPVSNDRYPLQDIIKLIKLRNALVHFEPETTISFSSCGIDSSQIHKFEKDFVGKFKLHPLTGEGNPFYPDKLLCAECAKWSVKSSIDFTDLFFSRIKKTPIYNGAREHYGI